MNEINKFLNVEDLLLFLKKESEKNLLAEICGLISYKENFFLHKTIKNISSSNNFFKISPKDYLDFLLENGCLCIFHSHIFGSEEPSETDILNSKNCCKPYLIYSVITEKFSIFEPHAEDYNVNIIELIKTKL